jgi:hypothetical protein
MADSDGLEQARARAGLTISALWLRYFALGGMGTPLEMEAALFGALVPDPHDRDLIIVALNERFAELGRGQPLAYPDD